MPHRLIHLFMPQSPQCQHGYNPKVTMDRLVSTPKTWNYRQLRLSQSTGKEVKSLVTRNFSKQNLGSTVSTCENVGFTLKWWPFEQANDDEATHSIWSFPKPSCLEAATCLCPVQQTARSWESSTHQMCLWPPNLNWEKLRMVRHKQWPGMCGFFFSATPFFFCDTCLGQADTHWWPFYKTGGAPSRSPRSRSSVKLYKTGVSVAGLAGLSYTWNQTKIWSTKD